MFQPVVGVAQNGVQTIALRDNAGVMREVKSTPEEIKEFLDKRAEYNQINKSYIMPSTIGAGLGVLVVFLRKGYSRGDLGFLGFMGATIGFAARAIQQLLKCEKHEQNFLNTNV